MAPATAREALWYAKDDSYDVIVLDLMLPGIDGLTLLERFPRGGTHRRPRAHPDRQGHAQRSCPRGLNVGADDYLVKPFAFEELLARIRALIRRKYDAKSPLIHVGDLEIDTLVRGEWRGIEEVRLSN